MNIQSGEILRKCLTENQNVRKIIHFGTFQAFKDRGTYTCILILAKRAQESFEIGFVKDWNRFLFDHAVECDSYPERFIGSQPWTFLPQHINEKIASMEKSCSKLSDMSDIFVGVQTSADKIYIIYAEREDEHYICFFDKDGKSRKIEKGILRKSVYDAKLTRYEPIAGNCYIVYPYRELNGKPMLLGLQAIKEQYPMAFEYLSVYRSELDKRNMPNRTEENWFAYGRRQSIKRFMKGEHLIWPVLSLDSNYVYDNKTVVFTGGGNGPFYGLEMKKDIQESIFYIQAILNHWLMEALVKSRASMFRGDYYSHGKQFIETLPIYRIDFSDQGEKALHDSIVAKVHVLENLSMQKLTAGNNALASVLTRSISAVLQEMNAVIDTIYGIQNWKTEE